MIFGQKQTITSHIITQQEFIKGLMFLIIIFNNLIEMIKKEVKNCRKKIIIYNP